jgi:glucose-6-phosphate isomerase
MATIKFNVAGRYSPTFAVSLRLALNGTDIRMAARRRKNLLGCAQQ